MITSFNSSQVFQITVWLLLLKELQNTQNTVFIFKKHIPIPDSKEPGSIMTLLEPFRARLTHHPLGNVPSSPR